MREREEGKESDRRKRSVTLKLYIVHFTRTEFMGELEIVLGEPYLL